MPNTLPKMKEIEIAKIAQMYFEQRGWDLFPEVVIKGFSGRPDFVGKKHSLCAAIECKQTLSYPVIEQVTRWRHDRDECLERDYTHSRIKAIPHLLMAFTGSNTKPLALLKKEILKAHRIGFYEVRRKSMPDDYLRGKSYKPKNPYDAKTPKLGRFYDRGLSTSYCQWKNFEWTVDEVVAPKLQEGSRKTAINILEQLNDDMKSATAGASGREGGFMTPFKRTMLAVVEILNKGGQYHMVDIMNALNEDFGGHHYSSDKIARSSIPKFIIELGIGHKVCETPPLFAKQQVNVILNCV